MMMRILWFWSLFLFSLDVLIILKNLTTVYKFEYRMRK